MINKVIFLFLHRNKFCDAIDMGIKYNFKEFRIFRENISMAYTALRSNKLRAALTIAIISLGITAIVGIFTAVDSISTSLNDAYSRMGAGIVNISSQSYIPGDRKRIRNPREISKSQAERFKDYFPSESATISMYSMVAQDIAVESAGRRTTPNMHVMATDENYLTYQDFKLAQGRNFTKDDITGGSSTCIIGHNIYASLFGKSTGFGTESPIGSSIYIKGMRYTVIGIATPVGNNGSWGMDGRLLVPYTNALANLSTDNIDFSLGILPADNADREEVALQATQAFRAVRRLAPYDRQDFDLSRSDAVMAELQELESTLSLAAAVIGLITLIGAAVGLMNIMLVSVKERTREIGTLKALGASSKRIRNQFLIEAVLIGESGGAIGIVAGIAIGNAVAAIMDNPFVIPWMWILGAIILCMIVGIASGYIPASRAASLDPIECLRYE